MPLGSAIDATLFPEADADANLVMGEHIKPKQEAALGAEQAQLSRRKEGRSCPAQPVRRASLPQRVASGQVHDARVYDTASYWSLTPLDGSRMTLELKHPNSWVPLSLSVQRGAGSDTTIPPLELLTTAMLLAFPNRESQTGRQIDKQGRCRSNRTEQKA